MPAKLDPKVAEEVMLKAGFKPLEAYKGAHTKWKCKCLQCKKIITPTYRNVKNGSKCVYCMRRKIDEIDAIKLMLKANLKPLEPYKGALVKWKCKCLKCGDIAYPKYNSIQSGHGGCQPCGYKEAFMKTRFSSKEATDIMISANFEPLEPYKNISNPWKSKCIKCNKTSRPSLASVKQRKTICAYCSKNKIDEIDAIKVMLKASLKPLEPYKSALVKWKCKCLKCGDIVHPQYSSIQSGQGGCINCSELGFNHREPAFFYVIFHAEMNSLKVGVANPDSKPERIAVHIQEGWALLRKYDFNVGSKAFYVETEILRWIRKDLRLPPYLPKELMKQGGWSETVDAEEVDLPTLYKKVDEVLKGLKE